MPPYQPPFQITETILNTVALISERVGRWSSLGETALTPQLRRGNRIRTIQASLAIENNTLSVEQVTAVIDGKRVLGLPREIQEVRNALEKHRASEERFFYPGAGSLIVPLESPDKRESFFLDIWRGRINLAKGKYQTRSRQVIVLVRLDFGGPPHRNPDGEEVGGSHFHLYREGYGDKWAYPVPPVHFPRLADLSGTLDDFMKYCNVTKLPHIDRGLFT